MASSYRSAIWRNNLRLLKLSRHHLSTSSKKESWRSCDVRKSFIDFFHKNHEHLIVPSSSVIPQKNQGTYFTNAGMNQFKPIFLGMMEPDSRLAAYRRVVNSQKCIRVGGKHNDLDDVGADLTHHTFFEMLGSWSFGDYFKKEACSMALDLLTGAFSLPKDQLYMTYFEGNETLGISPDLEVRDIWLSLGIPASHILPFGMKDNFWDMGESGPCGPCTEIHFDHVGSRNAASLVNQDSPDVVEVWNLVFIEFNRLPDESLVKLSKRHVDTGMGFERITAILQGSRSNYDTDLFQPLFSRIQKISGAPAYQGRTGADDYDEIDRGYRIIADHARMMCVSIADGLLPGGDNLEHKLRQIIYRSMKQAEDIFRVKKGLLPSLVDEVVESLGDTYPELEKNSRKIKEVLIQSEDSYFQMKEKGVRAFERMLRKEGMPSFKLAGKTVWDLHRGRYGDPVFLDQIMELADERGLHIDMDGFYRKQQEFKDQSASSSTAASNIELYFPALDVLWMEGVPNTVSLDKYNYKKTGGHYDFPTPRCQVISLLDKESLRDSVSAGDMCGVILDRTCFYHESGGQAADHGTLLTEVTSGCFEVSDVQDFYGYVIHIGKVTEGTLKTKDFVKTKIDEEFRLGCMKNHSATHILNSALTRLVGDTAQKGSDVTGDKFTFDFTSLSSISLDTVKLIEDYVIAQIKAGLNVSTQVLSLEEAFKIKGLAYLQNENYPNHVRVVTIGESHNENNFVSAELCGGTHVLNSADIEDFCIVRLKGVSAGTKRLSCVTGQEARQAHKNGEILRKMFETLQEDMKKQTNPLGWLDSVKNINKLLQEELLPKVIRDEISSKLEQLGETIKIAYNKEVQKLIREEILQLQMTEPTYIVKQISWQTDNKQMMKAVAEMRITQPTAILVEGERAFLVLLCAQKNNNAANEVLLSARDTLCKLENSKASPAKVGQDNVGHFVLLKGGFQPSAIADVIKDSFVRNLNR